jgi:hypothetical protein
MEVVDVKTKAKVILKEIMEQSPDDHDLTAIWDIWFERMADGVHLVYLNPDAARGAQTKFRRCRRRVDRCLRPFRPLSGLGESSMRGLALLVLLTSGDHVARQGP